MFLSRMRTMSASLTFNFIYWLLYWQEFSNQSPPSEFGHDITVTSAAGLQAKCIYHAAVRPYRDEHSVKVCAVLVFSQINYYWTYYNYLSVDPFIMQSFPGWLHYSLHPLCPSVCLSMPAVNSKTERRTTFKLSGEVSHVRASSSHLETAFSSTFWF